MKIIFDYNRTIFDPENNGLYPGVFELLKKLADKHELFLISRNEPSRKDRLEELGIKNYFKKTMFVDEKNTGIFKDLIGDSKNVLVVGDSLRDEIKTGNKLGLLTVRLKKGRFANEIPASPEEKPMFNISETTELEKIILNYEK